MKDGQLPHDAPSSLPDRYWSRGLHDAEICEIRELAFEVDWKSATRRRNSMIWILNSRPAMFETNVRSISFHNYKVLSDGGDLDRIRMQRTWWVRDTLTVSDGKYLLTVTLRCAFGDPFDVRIRFEEADVERT